MVASATQPNASARSPAHGLFQAYFSGLETYGKAWEPFVKGCARAHLELAGLMTRRAKSYMEIPNRLAQCRTPQDLANEQMRFWRTAYEDYSDSWSRVAEATAALARLPFGFGLSAEEADDDRDYITFPEAKEQGRSARERRAA